MKRFSSLFLAVAAIACMMSVGLSVSAQDDESETVSPFSVGVGLYNRYVWRGTDFGASPSFQPAIEYAIAGFAIGAWGAYPFITVDDASFNYEVDVYASYTYSDMVGVTITDYFVPLTGQSFSYFDYSDPNDSVLTSHGYEATLSFKGLENLPINITLAKFVGGFDDKSFYTELGYSFNSFDVFVGAGNEVYTAEAENEDESFNVVNVGISLSKELKISDTYSLPVSGSLVINPDAEIVHLVVGISF